jgi:hypothetical protein
MVIECNGDVSTANDGVSHRTIEWSLVSFSYIIEAWRCEAGDRVHQAQPEDRLPAL